MVELDLTQFWEELRKERPKKDQRKVSTSPDAGGQVKRAELSAAGEEPEGADGKYLEGCRLLWPPAL